MIAFEQHLVVSCLVVLALNDHIRQTNELKCDIVYILYFCITYLLIYNT